MATNQGHFWQGLQISVQYDIGTGKDHGGQSQIE
jgi:hypothetical protein